MTDVVTQKPLTVIPDAVAGPYFSAPVSQLTAIRELLDRHRVRYWVDEYAISLDGGPEVTVVNLGRNGSATAVQTLLDTLP